MIEGRMRYFLFLLVFGAIALAPFVMLKRPWAVRAWERVKKGFAAYVIAIAIIAIIWLVRGWQDFYG
jgi:hypothetical protein